MSHEAHDKFDGDALLHRYHDGELSPAERARVEAGLGPLERDKLAALDELGGSLRAMYGGAADRFDAWPALERELSQAAGPAAAVAPTAPSAKVLPFERPVRRRRSLWFSSSMAVAAAAAALLVVMRVGPTAVHPTNDCDVDEIEVSGAVDTILKLDDDDHGGSTTVLWIEE